MACMSSLPSGVDQGASRSHPWPSPSRACSKTATSDSRSRCTNTPTWSPSSSFLSQSTITGGRPASACHEGERRCSVDADGGCCGEDGKPASRRARRSSRGAVIESPAIAPARKPSWASSSRSARGETRTSAAGISAAALVSRSVLITASQEASGVVASTADRDAPASASSRRCTRCKCMMSWLVVDCSGASSGTRMRAFRAADQWQPMCAGAGVVKRPSSHKTAGAAGPPCARTSHQMTPARVERSTVHQVGLANHHHAPDSARSSATAEASSPASCRLAGRRTRRTPA
ncbi:hypothetical protein T492DRAFT_984227, partial [Pavlovales sp. CCMP2436]